MQQTFGGVFRWVARPWALGALVLGCGGGDDSTADQAKFPLLPGIGEDASADYTMIDVEWREGTRVLDDVPAVQAALLRSDSEAGTLVFDPAFSSLDPVQVGDAALIGGVGIYRILGRESTAEGEVLQVGDAALTDLVENGTFAWRKSFLSADDTTKYGLGNGEDEATTIRSLRQPLIGPDGVNFSQSLSGIQVDFTMTPVTDRSLEMSLRGQYGDGPAKLSVKLSGKLRALTNETLIQIDGHSLTNFRAVTSDLEGNMTVEAEAAALGNVDTTVKVPARITLPIVLGGIPFHIDLGGAVELSSTLNTKGTAKFKGSSRFSGGGGIEYENGNLSLINSLEQSDMSLDDSSLSSNITVGLRVSSVFPELGIGIGVQQVSATAFLRFKTEVLSNLEIQQRLEFLGPLPTADTETKFCLTGKVGIGATFGGSAKFLGFDIADKEVPIWTQYGDEAKSGAGCQ
jgi:hypothetical protein